MGCRINANLSGTNGKIMKIINYFVDKGLTPTQACAICGNISAESSFNENAVNSTTKAFGLFQFVPRWHPKFNVKRDFDYQLDYAWQLFNSGRVKGNANEGSDTYKKWKDTEIKSFFQQNTGTLYDYTELWMCAIERCSVKEYKTDYRVSEAKKCAELYNKYVNKDCAEIDLTNIGSADNESTNLDTENAVDNNGAVVSQTELQIDCGQIGTNNTAQGSSNTDGAETNNSSSGLPTGFSGEVTNPKMKKVLADVSYFRNKPRDKNGKKVKLQRGKYQGLCTYGPSTWYNNAGINLFFWCGEYRVCGSGSKKKPYLSNFDCIRKRMEECGFYLAGHWDFEEARNNPTSIYRPGDVATLAPPCSAHGLMWTGHDWRSDCIEDNICQAYRRVKKGKFGNYSVCIWRRADFQEPGLDTTPVT